MRRGNSAVSFTPRALVVVVCGFAPIVHATQAGPWDERSISTSVTDTDSVDAADLNGDGVQDVLSASPFTGDLFWHENALGDGTMWITTMITSSADGVRDVLAADIDGDGDADVVYAASTLDEVGWYENAAGDASTWVAGAISTTSGGVRSVHAADVDGDGDLDVLSASFVDDEIDWHENVTGDGSTWVDHGVAVGVDGAWSVVAGDVDGDGDVDVLSAGYEDDEIDWYDNDAGDGSSWVGHLISATAYGARSVRAADVDGDGDLDALSAAEFNDEVSWHENTSGDGSLWTEHSISAAVDDPSSLGVVDADADGALDVLSTAKKGDEVAWHENKSGDGSTWIGRIVSVKADNPEDVGSADFDDDGDADVVSASSMDDTVAWYENLASPPMCELQELLAAAGGPDDRFGAAVAVNGDLAAVGAFLEDGAIGNEGAIHVFRLQEGDWLEEARLVPSDASVKDRFGTAVAVSGDRVVAGSLYDDDAGESSGSVYVFHFDGAQWVEEAKLTAADAGSQDAFGTDVAIDGDRILAGSAGDDDLGNSAGAAYVFKREASGWIEEAKLHASDAGENDRFGNAVSLSGDLALIGAREQQDEPKEGALVDSGAAYVFRLEGASWVEEAKLVAGDAESSAWFGYDVALDGDLALIGAFVDALNDDGAAYVFRRSGTSWMEEAKLVPADVASNDNFGISVAIDDGVALVGSWHDDTHAGTRTGSAYVFEGPGGIWSESGKLVAMEAGEHDEFGASVSLSGSTAWIGAAEDDDLGTDSGSANAFWLGPCLATDYAAVSLANGGQQKLLLGAGQDSASNLYLVAGTASGTHPGTAWEAVQIPLNLDAYTLYSISHAGSPPLLGTFGVLDASGAASASILIPLGSNPSLAGVKLHHAYVTLSPVTAAVVSVSHALPLELLP